MTEISEEPTDEQQEAIDALDRRTGFNPNPPKSKTKPKEEPLPEPQIPKMKSMEEWRTLTIEKYEHLKKVIEGNLPQLWLAIEFILAIKSIMNIARCYAAMVWYFIGKGQFIKDRRYRSTS